MRGRKVPSRIPSVQCDRHHSLGASVQCEQSAALGASLGVGPAQKVSSRDKPASSPFAPFLLGTASPCYHLAAIPTHLRRGKPRRKCSGRPGCGRPGRWRRLCRFGPRLRRCPNRQRLRGSARISGVALYLYSSDSACSREPMYPARTSVRRSLCILTILTPILMMLTPSKRAGLSKSSPCLLANRQRCSYKVIAFSFS